MSQSAAEQKKGRLRWKRVPRSAGLRGMVEAVRHEYTDGVERHATVQARGRHEGGGWFWYASGVSTSDKPVATVEEAKRQAEEHVKAVLYKKAVETPVNQTPLRSPNYAQMSPREQWEEDKRHGYLDL